MINLIKSQIPSIKLQINLNYQLSMTKTFGQQRAFRFFGYALCPLLYALLVSPSHRFTLLPSFLRPPLYALLFSPPQLLTFIFPPSAFPLPTSFTFHFHFP
jgi:hypothetical protein